ncbi:unnamed protein product [Amaranthus hypochondriacus]
MIQELLGGGSVPNGLLSERKNSIPFTSSCSSSTPILTTTITTSPSTASLTNAAHSSSNNNNTNTTNNNTNSEANPSQQNLRCPRCDSTNTKFCYYNNYNLTQPRHFCKTCRRYWTKGGTLRNVPIGGGCRKNKTITANNSSSSGFVKPSPNAMAKAKATLSSELLLNGNPGNFLGSGLLDPELPSNYPNPIFWSSLPQNSHILSLLRGSNSTQFHNPNPNPNPIFGIKTESGLGLDSYGNGAPSNLNGSFSRGNQNHINGLFSSGAQDFIPNNGNNNNNSNILELYQRLKSSSNYSYCSNDNPGNTVILGNMVGSSSALSSTILDSAPIGGGDNSHFGGYHGLMNSPALISGWSDIPTLPININGAYP